MSTEIPLRANLRECGRDLVSDWAILNYTKSRQLRRILKTVHACTDIEIEQACYLLESYHAVYRPNLIRLRAQGCRGKCPLPTTAQLQQIAQHLQTKTAQSYSPQQVMHELQAIAKRVKSEAQSAQKLRQRCASNVLPSLNANSKLLVLVEFYKLQGNDGITSPELVGQEAD